MHPQEPVLPLAHCQAPGRGGAGPPASGTQGTVCTRCTAGCKEAHGHTGCREAVSSALAHVGGGTNAPSPDDQRRPRSPAWRHLVRPQTSSLLHTSALCLLPPSVREGDRWHVPTGHPVSAHAGAVAGRAPFPATCWLPFAVRFPEIPHPPPPLRSSYGSETHCAHPGFQHSVPRSVATQSPRWARPTLTGLMLGEL